MNSNDVVDQQAIGELGMVIFVYCPENRVNCSEEKFAIIYLKTNIKFLKPAINSRWKTQLYLIDF